MKPNLFLSIICACIVCYQSATAQTDLVPADVLKKIPVKDGKIVYEGVVTEPGKKKDLLYVTARKWFVNTYYDSKQVMQMDDKAAGSLMGKGIHAYAFSNGIHVSQISVRFTVAIDIKDGKYRYRIYEFDPYNTSSSFLGDKTTIQQSYEWSYNELAANKRVKYHAKMLEGLNAEVKGIVASLEKAMKNAQSDDF